MRGTIQGTASIAGLAITSAVTRTADGHIAHNPTLAAGKAGTLTTRTDDDTGVATLSTGHGIQTGDLVDVYWADGVRYGMECAVSGNLVTIDGGAGDVLPASSTSVTVSPVTVIDTDFGGDGVTMIRIYASRRAQVDIRSAAASIKAVELAAGEAWDWYEGADAPNPLAGQTVASIRASAGSTSTALLKIGLLCGGTASSSSSAEASSSSSAGASSSSSAEASSSSSAEASSSSSAEASSSSSAGASSSSSAEASSSSAAPALPGGLMLFWDGASIPSGWEDVSADYAGYLRQETHAGHEATGLGNAGHYHTAESTHTHDFGGHSHAACSVNSAPAGAYRDPENPGDSVAEAHSHGITCSMANFTSGSHNATTRTGDANNDPPFFPFQLIRSTSATQIPDDALVLAADDILAGFDKVDVGSARLLKVAVGGRGCGYPDGNATHDDALQADDHDLNHYHYLTVSDASPNTVTPNNSGVDCHANVGNHSHSCADTSQAGSTELSVITNGPTGTDNTGLLNRLALMLWRAAAEGIARDGIVALWDSLESGAVPSGWNILAGTDGDFVFLSNTGDGSRTAASSHPAVAVKHNSRIANHDHTAGPTGAASSTTSRQSGSDVNVEPPTHTVTISSDAQGWDVAQEKEETLVVATSGSNPSEPLAPPSCRLLLIVKDGDS